MPWLSNTNKYPHFNYSFLGSNGIEAFNFLLMHPIESVKTLFYNHTGDPSGDYIKAEFHTLILLSGLPLLLLKPQYLLMLIPIYFQKLFHNNFYVWGIDGQYSIEFAPILAIGIFSVINDFKNEKIANLISIIILISTFACTVRIMDHTILYTAKSKIRFYQGIHYTRNYSVKKVHELLSTIPKNAIVSAQSPFLPHLALRDNIYQFPLIKDAEFIIYSEKEGSYPLEKSAFNSLTQELENSNTWKVLYKDENITILQKALNWRLKHSYGE